eukprot:6861114-Lingulodinium_polyedra.AAC.1
MRRRRPTLTQPTSSSSTSAAATTRLANWRLDACVEGAVTGGCCRRPAGAGSSSLPAAAFEDLGA